MNSCCACDCRESQEKAARCRAVELYKELQQVVQDEHGFENDQNALVLRMISDCLATIDQYGEPFILWYYQPAHAEAQTGQQTCAYAADVPTAY